jgi:tetratricopeptide (TPR) repeat protein
MNAPSARRPSGGRSSAAGIAVGISIAAALATLAALAGLPNASAQTMPFAPPSDSTVVSNANRDAHEVTVLLRNGRVDAANSKVEAMLAKNPKDAQARFLKGLVLTDQGKTADAIQAFRALTEDYPELPEPYNNLGSLYATTGQFDQARIALESAIAANPSYVIAHDNLGDLYVRLAAQAYDKVLQLDRTSAATRAKAAALRNAVDAAKLPAR